MNNDESIHRLLDKAARAARSAKTLLDGDDPDGACSRAYYAMFDAARAAILAADESADLALHRTHKGVLSAFSERLVKTGRLPAELGRSLRRAETARVMADYREASVEAHDAATVVEDAQTFLAAIEQFRDRIDRTAE